MRLLKANADGSFSLTWFPEDQIPPYAILSHRWEPGDQEVTHQDLTGGIDKATPKLGYEKIQFCGNQAKHDHLIYFWVDSCCIDKSSSAELTEALNSMFRWYQNAAKCYVYLSDVSSAVGKCDRSSHLLWESAFDRSLWFTRGWTLQELLAPSSVEFFSREGVWLGDKQSLKHRIVQITGIAVQALRGDSLLQFSVEERMAWAENRETTREEDQAYCLMGIFGVYLPVIYGEGKQNAKKRLQVEIQKVSKELECLQSLRTSDYERFKDRNPDRLEGTCEWFLLHDRYHEWQQSNSGLLWVSADPGCGKSVLAKSLIDREMRATSSRTISSQRANSQRVSFRATCYFFFKDDNEKQKSSTIALSSLLHQLFSQKQYLIRHAMRDYETEGSNLSHSFAKLWNTFILAISDPNAGEVVCVLDALDECAEAERYQIIDTLSAFYKQCQSSQLKFLVTSRPYFDIEREFANLIRHFPTIHLQGEKESEAICREIDIVIKSKVSELGLQLKLDDSEQSALQDELLAMEHRTYLWLKLMVDVIRGELEPTKNRLKGVINTLPATVDQAYEAILSKAKDQRRARKILYIIVAAIRPLTLKEISIALAIEDYHRSYEDLDLNLQNEARLATTIRNLCGLFVNVIDQKVYLIHQTAKDFLVAKDQALLGGWKHSISPVESSFLMARICITYLMFRTFEDEFIDDTEHHRASIKQHGYREYAASFWGIHYREAQSRKSDATIKSALTLCDTRSRRFQIWFNIYWETVDKHGSVPQLNDIAVASYFGHEDIVKLLLAAKADVDSKGDTKRTPLSWAAGNGHEGVVRLLLAAKADVDSKGDTERTPLSWAAENGHEGVVRLLLAAKADVNSKDCILERTPLSWAAENGHEGVVRLLLAAKADVDSKDCIFERTPLSWAAGNGHEGIVKLLLAAKADIDLKDYYGRTPLSWAAENGHEGIIKLLQSIASSQP